MRARNFNDLDPSVLDVGVGGAVLADDKGFADVASLRRGLRPPCPWAAPVAGWMTSMPGWGAARSLGADADEARWPIDAAPARSFPRLGFLIQRGEPMGQRAKILTRNRAFRDGK